MWWWHWWFPLQHWLAIHLGVDNEPGPYYGFFSGSGSDLGEIALIGGLVAMVRRHNCEVRRCWRIGRHKTAAGHHVCRVHSPRGAPTHKDVLDAHHEALRQRNKGDA
jgi:hypothetical protein